jgi:hypothetical protein
MFDGRWVTSQLQARLNKNVTMRVLLAGKVENPRALVFDAWFEISIRLWKMLKESKVRTIA